MPKNSTVDIDDEGCIIRHRRFGGKFMTIDQIKDAVISIKDDYPIAKVVLFGSRANGTNKSDSDIDLIMEFTEGISLLTLVAIKASLEEILGVSVDVIHGPITEDDMIEVGEEIELYAA